MSLLSLRCFEQLGPVINDLCSASGISLSFYHQMSVVAFHDSCVNVNDHDWAGFKQINYSLVSHKRAVERLF